MECCAMNRTETRDLARFLISDQAGTIIEDPSFNRLIDIAIQKVVGEIRQLDQDALLKTAPLNTSSSVREYPFTNLASDIDRVRMIEKVQSPKYPKLHRLDWLKHKLAFETTGEPSHYTTINSKILLLKVPNAIFVYTVYYDPMVVPITKDTDPIPLIPAKFHDLVSIWSAVMARGAIASYSKLMENTAYLTEMLAERQHDLVVDMAGTRSEEVEVTPGVLGGEASAR
jgi:hypothetical protein